MICIHCLNTGVRQCAESRNGHLSIVDEPCACRRLVGCSSCGESFPPLAEPFDTGFSHCDQHQNRRVTIERADLDVDLVEATLTQRQAQREHAAAEKLLRSARAFADLVVGTPLATNAEHLLQRAMIAMNLATMNRLRAAQNVNGIAEAMRAEGRPVPVVPEMAAA